MQQPKMIVMGLIGRGIDYGFEMERHIDLTRMRLWARIGKSTIYKALRDLQRDGAVTQKSESAARGPGKTVYRLTTAGKKSLAHLVKSALQSRESVYSDRVAGLVFSQSLPKKTAVTELESSIYGIGEAIKSIDSEISQQDDKTVAYIVLHFYRKVYVAEREALLEMKTALG